MEGQKIHYANADRVDFGVLDRRNGSRYVVFVYCRLLDLSLMLTVFLVRSRLFGMERLFIDDFVGMRNNVISEE